MRVGEEEDCLCLLSGFMLRASLLSSCFGSHKFGTHATKAN